MEISELDKSVIMYDDKIIDIPNVSNLLKKLKELDLNNILDLYNAEFNKIHGEIIKLYNSDEDNKIELLGSFLNECIKCLKEGIKSKNINFILIFFRLFQILPFYVSDLLNFNKITEEEYKCIEIEIFKFLQKFNFEIHTEKNIDFDEIINNGFNNESISSVKQIFPLINNNYQFISQFEFLEYLLFFLKESNIDLYFNIFLESNTLQKAFFCLKNLNKEDLILLSKKDKLNNKWLIFGVIDKILEHFNDEDDEIIILLGDLINKVKDDFNFFKQLILNYKNDSLFNSSLGYLLPKLSPSEFNKTIEECFIMDKYNSSLKSKDNFLMKYKEFSEKEDYKKLLKLIFLKWDTFLEDCLNSDEYFIDIILTDFANFILQYYCFCCSNEEIIKSMINCLKFINDIDSIWSSSFISLSNKFCICFSRLYILSYAYCFKELDDNKVNELFSEFFKNEILKNKFSIRNKEDYFKKIQKNILK